jgi:hypothetical protein
MSSVGFNFSFLENSAEIILDVSASTGLRKQTAKALLAAMNTLERRALA